MDKGCIYLITNKMNGKQYIGQTFNFNFRKRQYFSHSKKHDRPIEEAIEKYGEDKFKIEIIHDNISKECINDWEIYYINEVYNTFKGKGYNAHIGGNCQSGESNPMSGLYGKDNPRYGQTHSKESKKKISKNHADTSGSNNPMYGKIGFNNPNSDLELEDFYRIINLRVKGYLKKEIADKLGINEDVVREIIKNKHSICKQVNYSFDFNLFRDIFDNSSPVSIKDIYLIRNFRKDNITQIKVSNLLNISESTINNVDSNLHVLCPLVNKSGVIREDVLKFIEDFSKEFNDLAKNRESIKEFIKSFKNYKKWFKEKFSIEYSLFCKYAGNRTYYDLNDISEALEFKTNHTYEETKNEFGISASLLRNIKNDRHWVNNFLDDEYNLVSEYYKIKLILN